MIDYNNDLFYSGVGSRSTPDNIAKLQAATSQFLSTKNYVLRSGWAIGSDQNHSRNAVRSVDYVTKIKYDMVQTEDKHFIVPNFEDYIEIMKSCCPHWRRLNDYSTKLHSRNICQGQGHFADNPIYSKFTLAYTENGEIEGGTATMIRFSMKKSIPIFNYGKYKYPNVKNSLRDFLRDVLNDNFVW